MILPLAAPRLPAGLPALASLPGRLLALARKWEVFSPPRTRKLIVPEKPLRNVKPLNPWAPLHPLGDATLN